LDARKTLYWLIKQQLILTGWVAKKEKTFVEIHLYKPTQRGDSANFVDSVLDVVKDAIMVDDHFFVPSAPWSVDRIEPRIEITIWQEERENDKS